MDTRDEKGSHDQALIRQRMADWAQAIRARDVNGVLSLYAPDIVSFDIGPPLRYTGYRPQASSLAGDVRQFPGAIGYEVTDLTVAAGGDLAFAHSLNHVSGRLASGHDSDMWVRSAACFRRVDGPWLVVHDHASVPADLEHGKSVTDLVP